MSNTPFSLTRQQLAEFLPNQRAVIAFEKLLSQVNTAIPNDTTAIYALIAEAATEAASADARAQAALDQLKRIADALEMIALAPAVENARADDPAPINQATAIPDDVSPPVQIGTLGQQQADRVAITGGSITAALTNNQTVLMTTSATLTDGSAAAAATLANAPVAGNPTKWVSINDNGVTRHIPAW